MNRYEKMVVRIAGGYPSSSGTTGRGRLVEYKGKKDSWILNQMDKGKVDSGIETKGKKNNKTFKTKGGKY